MREYSISYGTLLQVTSVLSLAKGYLQGGKPTKNQLEIAKKLQEARSKIFEEIEKQDEA